MQAGTTRTEWARRRYELVAYLISHYERKGIIDPETNLEIGTYQWFASQVVKQMGGETTEDGTPVLPKGYFSGGDVAAMTFGRDYYRIREKTKTKIADNIEAVRNYKTHQLEHLSEKLYSEIVASPKIGDNLYLVEQWLRITDRITKINGLETPVRSVQANLNIDFSKLTRAQLDQIIAGEAPEQVLALGPGEEADEEVFEAEYAEAD